MHYTKAQGLCVLSACRASVAIALLRTRNGKRITEAEPAKKKRRAAFEEADDEAAEHTSKRREIEAVSIVGEFHQACGHQVHLYKG